jgi:transcriptional regulator with XRE-family HTH domain
MSKATISTQALPASVTEELTALGRNLGIARRRRRISRREMAQRMMVNPKTVDRMETGDPKLGVGILATALWVLGVDHRLGGLLTPETDKTGIQEEIRNLPHVIRRTSAQAKDARSLIDREKHATHRQSQLGSP